MRSSCAGFRGTEDELVSPAAAAAEGGGSGTAAAAAQFQGEGEGEPRAAHGDRVAQGDDAVVDLHPSGGHATGVDGSEGGGEGLVDLDEVRAPDTSDALAAERVTDGVGGLDQRRVRVGAVGADLGDRAPDARDRERLGEELIVGRLYRARWRSAGPL